MRFVLRDIREVWDGIKDKLTDLVFEEDRVEEVYHTCRNKKAFVFTVAEGFIIATEVFRSEKNINKKSLFIWFAYGEGIDLFEKYNQDLVELARISGCSDITFKTRRKGFERVIPEGWKMDHVQYKLEINNV